jgi:cytochrome c1
MTWRRVRTALLAGLLALLASACAASSQNAAPADPAAAAGQTLIAQKGCGGCHTVPGVPGANGVIGPSLAGVASRTTIAGGAVPNNGPDDLKRWILNPPAVKPGTPMPNLGLSDDEATKIVAYLETLK